VKRFPSTPARGLRVFIALHCLALSGSFVAALLVASTFATAPSEPLPRLAIADRVGETTRGTHRDTPIATPTPPTPIPAWARVDDDPPPPWATDR
jgi:hypothetical protein